MSRIDLLQILKYLPWIEHDCVNSLCSKDMKVPADNFSSWSPSSRHFNNKIIIIIIIIIIMFVKVASFMLFGITGFLDITPKGLTLKTPTLFVWAVYLSQYSSWLRVGRPGDRGSIPGRGERIIPLASVSRSALVPTQPAVQWGGSHSLGTSAVVHKALSTYSVNSQLNALYFWL
jgi:hypothetical protein